MTQGQEVIEFSGSAKVKAEGKAVGESGGGALKTRVLIVRGPSKEVYLALQPPTAQAYVVAPYDLATDEVVQFVRQRLDSLIELQTDMLKHFSKTKSLKCHFKTGDVIHLFGRPFMLRVHPLSSTKKNRKPTRGLASMSARLYNDLSLIELFVAQVGSYEQGLSAYMSYARPIFAHNIKNLLTDSMARVFPDASLPEHVKCRPMRERWVHLDDEHDTVWFSERLISYPPNAVVYAYLSAAIKKYTPDIGNVEHVSKGAYGVEAHSGLRNTGCADDTNDVDGGKDVTNHHEAEDEYAALMEKGVPDWQEMRAILADQNSKYVL